MLVVMMERKIEQDEEILKAPTMSKQPCGHYLLIRANINENSRLAATAIGEQPRGG
jgi:hypothetical protein